MQKTIFRTKSTIPCRDDAELASEQTYQTAFTASVTADFQPTWDFISPSAISTLFGVNCLCDCIFFVGRFALLFCA